jgi:hypothetical protein
MMDDQPFIVRKVTAVCRGCGAERSMPIDPPFESAKDFLAWHKRGGAAPLRCDCGAETCDLKLWLPKSS